jgi:AcrR family transcriptional regulator
MTEDLVDTQPRLRPGRPRSEQSRTAVLRAASGLMQEGGLRAMTTELIAARSGVSKATIYKWWPNKYTVAVEAFLSEMLAEAPDPDTGSAREDFCIVLRGVMHFYNTTTGRVFAQLVGEAQFDPLVHAELRDVFIQARRRVGRAIWDRGVARGELRADIDPEIGIDVVFAPAIYRLVTGSGPLNDAAAEAIVVAALSGLAV